MPHPDQRPFLQSPDALACYPAADVEAFREIDFAWEPLTGNESATHDVSDEFSDRSLVQPGHVRSSGGERLSWR
jgi:hypothetical protein